MASLSALTGFALLQASTFAFPGGDSVDLARALEAAFDVPVVMMGSEIRHWPAFKLKAEDDKGLFVALANRTKLEVAKGRCLVLHAPHWPRAFLSKQNSQFYEGLFKRTPDERVVVRGSHATIKLDSGEALTLSQLQLGLKEHVTWHWFFSEARLIIAAKDAPTRPLLEAIASAIGAKAAPVRGTIYLDLDTNAFRQRAKRMKDLKLPKEKELGSNDARSKADSVFLAELLGSLTDSELQSAYAKRGLVTEVKVSTGTALHKAILARLDARYPKDTSSLLPATANVAQWIRENVDLSKPCSALVYSDGVPAMKLGTKDGKGVVL